MSRKKTGYDIRDIRPFGAMFAPLFCPLITMPKLPSVDMRATRQPIREQVACALVLLRSRNEIADSSILTMGASCFALRY
jgi:hypothetical protein